MSKIPTQQRATTNKQKVYFRATRMRENVRQKSAAQISRQTCVAQQNVQAVCKRVLVWFAIATASLSNNRRQRTCFAVRHVFCNLCVGNNFFVGTKTHYHEPCKGKKYFLRCIGRGFNVNFAVCRLVCISRQGCFTPLEGNLHNEKHSHFQRYIRLGQLLYECQFACFFQTWLLLYARSYGGVFLSDGFRKFSLQQK